MHRLLIALLFVSFAATSIAQDKKVELPKKKRNFTIGKDTTYVTGPIDQDGFVDYLTALNEHLSKGVTPQNNANVLLGKAFGPHPEGSNIPAEYFQLLKSPAPPQMGDYFVSFGEFARVERKLDAEELAKLFENEYDVIASRPWKAKEHPQFAAWLKHVEKPLAVVHEATKRTHYYNPLATPKVNGRSGLLISALLPSVQSCRGIGTALTARAMLRVEEGKYDDAWQDLLACHRLGRHVGKGGTLIESLVGLAIDNIASKADLAFIEHAKVDAKRAKSCQRDLDALPKMSPMADKIQYAERFLFLDIVMKLNERGIDVLQMIGPGPPPNAALRTVFADVNWDPALRNGNAVFTRLTVAMRLNDRTLREKHLNDIDVDIKTLKANLITPEEFIRTLLGTNNVAEAKGKFLGDILISLLVPAVRKVQQAGDRNQQTEQNLRLAFALAAYKSDEGRYPAKLDALAPKYVESVPVDTFTGKALVYRPNDKGYLLYSVGINGQDDNGRSQDDDPPADDIIVRMPWAKLSDRK